MRLEPRDTPFGRILVAIDPDDPDQKSEVVDVAGQPVEADLTSSRSLSTSTTRASTIRETVEAVHQRLKDRIVGKRSPERERLSSEANEVMDAADAVIQEMLHQHLDRFDSSKVQQNDPTDVKVIITEEDNTNDQHV